MKNTKGNSIVQLILIIVLTTLIVGGAGYYIFGNKIMELEGEIDSLVTEEASNVVVDSSTVEEVIDEVPDSLTAKTVLYSDMDNEFNFLANNGCEEYLKITSSKEGTKIGYSISLPSAKEWNGDLMYFELVSQEEYDEILNDGMPGAPRITLDLDSDVLYSRGLIQDWPIESDLPENCKEVTAEKV